MITKVQFITLMNIYSAISNGSCEKPGYYVPANDIYDGDFITNKKYFNIGEEFTDEHEWIYVSDFFE